MQATKEQERKALEQIKEIVDGLGENNHVAAAFDGCFELAETNIIYDGHSSWRWVAQIYEKKFFDVERERVNLEEKCQALEHDKEDLENALDQLDAIIADLREDNEKLRQWKGIKISHSDVKEIMNILDTKIDDANDIAGKAADDIVRYARKPESKEFKDAVDVYGETMERIEIYANLYERVMEAVDKEECGEYE